MSYSIVIFFQLWNELNCVCHLFLFACVYVLFRFARALHFVRFVGFDSFGFKFFKFQVSVNWRDIEIANDDYFIFGFRASARFAVFVAVRVGGGTVSCRHLPARHIESGRRYVCTLSRRFIHRHRRCLFMVFCVYRNCFACVFCCFLWIAFWSSVFLIL